MSLLLHIRKACRSEVLVFRRTVHIAALAAVIAMCFAGVETRGADEKEWKTPKSCTLLCNGHVTGAPEKDGRAGPHIVWSVYASPETPESLAAHVRDTLPAAWKREDGESCSQWRRRDDGSESLLEVCPVDAPGPRPSSECDGPPKGTRSLLTLSKRIGP